MQLWQKDFGKTELMRRIGDVSQAFGVRKAVFEDGQARDTRVYDFKTGTGFSFTVLPDRGLDVCWCDFQGVPLSFVSKTGPVSPYHYVPEDRGFLRSFTAGLLTTCGMTNMGASCVDEGVPLSMHGHYSHLPSEETACYGRWEGDEYVMTARGVMREARVFHENLQLTRTITCRAGENRFFVHDVLENCGYDESPMMMLYHCNYGYPIVSEHSRLYTSPSEGVRPRDEAAAPGLGRYSEFSEPIHQFAEQVYYHDLTPDKDKKAWGCIFNEKLSLGAYVRYSADTLPWMIQWKQMGEGDYTCGLEPATWNPEGRDKARASGNLYMIQPGEKMAFSLEIGVVTSPDQLK